MENSRSNISDDQLDELFRHSAEEMNVEYDAASWQKLNQRLNGSGMTEGNHNWREWALLPIILLLFLSSSYWYVRSGEKSFVETQQKNKAKQSKIASKETNGLVTNPNEGVSVKASESGTYEENGLESKKELEKLSGATSENKNIEPEKAIVENSKNKFKPIHEANSVTNQENEKKIITENKEKATVSEKNKILSSQQNNQENNKIHKASQPFIALPTNSKNSQLNTLKNFSGNGNKEKISEEKTIEQSSIITKAKNQKVTNEKVNFPQKNEENLSIKNSQLANNQVVTNESKVSENNNSVIPEATEKWQMSQVSLFLPKQAQFENSLKLPNITTPESPEIMQVGNIDNGKNSIFRKGLSMQILYSPDLSTILPNDFAKVGSNVGIILEYRFSKRFSLNTGVIKSVKNYDAYGTQYYINPKWNVGVTPTNIDATCKMLDIPLNIRYDFTQNPRSRWFATTGVTSYLIQNEDYKYSYAMHVDGIHYSYTTNTGNYFLSNINLSLGYEKQIFKKISWQMEPFARIPIANLGFGKVKLATFGTFISVKYRF